MNDNTADQTISADKPIAELALFCRCGTEANPVACVGGCEYLCQRLARDRKGESTK